MTDSDNSRNQRKANTNSTSFTVGAIAIVFLALGYQTALFIHKASIERIVSNADHPDTVFVYTSSPNAIIPETSTEAHSERRVMVKKESEHSGTALKIREKHIEKKVENFPFDPNKVSVSELMRLGFSNRQAQSIINYREAGGRFNRKEDFGKSYVVSDSVYKRLEPYINISRMNLNQADSADLDRLPGIGPYYVRKILELRGSLGSFSSTDQLLEIENFGYERYERIKNLITVEQL